MKRQAFFLVTAVALGGCGPNLQAMVQAKHYREAVCAADEGNAEERTLVGGALDQDADVQMAMHVVSSDEMRPILGAKTDEAMKRGRIIRVFAQSNVLPVDDLELDGNFVNASGQTAALVADWSTLAWVTNEKLPPQMVDYTYITTDNLARLTAAVLTGGFSLLFTEFQARPYSRDPPFEKFAAIAPKAAVLYRTTGGSVCSPIHVGNGIGRRCTWYFVLDNASTSPVSLNLKARYVSVRQTGKSTRDEEGKCAVERVIRIPLGTPGQIETTVRERFGEKMVPVRVLRATD